MLRNDFIVDVDWPTTEQSASTLIIVFLSLMLSTSKVELWSFDLCKEYILCCDSIFITSAQSNNDLMPYYLA